MVEPTIGNTIGAAFLGILGSSIIFGAIAMQIFMYYNHFQNDWRVQKIFVGWLMFINMVHLAFAIHAVYFYVIMSFGDNAALDYVVWTFKVQAVMDVITVMSVQGLYAWRVRALGKHFSRVWPWIVIVIIIIGSAFGILLVVNTCQTEKWDRVEKFQWVLFGSFIFATFIDFLIATTLCYYLTRSRSSFSETNNRILRIMHYVLACGFLTSACSLGAVVALATMPKTLVFIGVDFMLPRLYTLSYMAMLNARKVPVEKTETSFNVTGALNQFRTGQNSAWADQIEGKPTVTMETEIISDPDAIPLATSKYSTKTSQHESNIGITVHRTENRHYDS